MDYVQDPSSAHFSDDPIPKLVREVLQNSLDAREPGLRQPVKVEFVQATVDPDLVGAPQLAAHVRSCIERAEDEELGEKVAEMYKRALTALEADSISCLRVTDSGTTGLEGQKWNALVRQEGSVQKTTAAHGGSYGIGKNAVLNVSDAKAVIYSTRFVCRRRGRVERMQGKATLMSHPNPDNPAEGLQHIGFYRLPNNQPLVTREIPDFFRLPDVGTGVFVLGFSPRSSNWIRDVAAAVLRNFFCAVHQRKLVVEISSSSLSSNEEPARVVVSHDTIDHLFSELFKGQPTPDAYSYYLAIRDADPVTTDKVPKLGALDVHVTMGSGPRRTAYVTRNGMLISASREQKTNPLAPVNKALWPDYAAVVVPATDRGDAWVRTMEPPSHDSVSPGELPDEASKRAAERVFRKARGLVRDIIDKKANIDRFGDTSNLDELAHLFPDELDPSREGNVQLEIRKVVQRRPVAGDDSEPGPGQGGSGSGTDGSSGSGTGDGHSDSAPGPNPGPSRRPNKVNIRFVPVGKTEAVVAFTPRGDALEPITIKLAPAGAERDSVSPIAIVSAQVVDGPGTKVKVADGVATLVPESQERIQLRVATDQPIGDFAVRVG